MAYNETQITTFTRSTANDGLLLQSEFARLYGNFSDVVGNTGSAPPETMKQLSDNKAAITYVATEKTVEEVYYISGAGYTILDNDNYTEIDIVAGTSDRTVTLPTLSANQSRKVVIRKLDGAAGKVIVTPEGTDLLNDWNSTFEITEKGGQLKCLGLSTHWECTPNENCCIYEVSSETADTGLDLTGIWDDVNGMVLLNGIYGNGKLSAFVSQRVYDTSAPSYIEGRMGLGTIAGNNAPNIPKAYDYVNRVTTIANTMAGMWMPHLIKDIPYESTGVPIYMKIIGYCDELNFTTHEAYGASGVPMYIRWRRTR